MPCWGLRDNLEDFYECLDQLNEIMQKYMSTHITFIGGDWNEDIYLEAQSRRKQTMKDLLLENDLVTTQTHKTLYCPHWSISFNYGLFFIQRHLMKVLRNYMCWKILRFNVSDHLPVCCMIDFSLDKVTTSANIDKQVNPRVQWAKVDTEVYTAAIEESISSKNTDFFADNLYDLDTTVRKVNNILNEAAMKAAPKRKKH